MIHGIQWVRDLFLFIENIFESFRFVKMSQKTKYLKEKEYKEALVKNQYNCIMSFLVNIFCLKRCAKNKET